MLKKKSLRRAIRIKRFRERHIYHIRPNHHAIWKKENKLKILHIIKPDKY